MKNITALYLILLLATAPLFAQSDAAIGDWKAYLGHYQAIQTIERDSIIYCVSHGGMYSYDLKENNFRSFSTIEGLTDVQPNSLFYHKDKDMIFLGYSDGSIDYFQSPDNIQHFTDIQRNDFYTQKAIANFAGKDSFLYVATDFGAVIFDLNKAEPKFTITQILNNPVRTPIQSLTVFEDKLWACLGDSGVFYAPINALNFSDPAIWTKASGIAGLPLGKAHGLVSDAENMLVIAANEIYRKNGNSWQKYLLGIFDYEFLRLYNNTFIAFRSDGTVIESDISGANVSYNYQGGGITDIDKIGETTWYSSIYMGLYQIQNGENVYFTPPGPRTNYCTQMAVGKNELYIAALGYDAVLVPQYESGGIFAYSKKWAENAGWKILNSANGGLPKYRANWNFVRAFYDKNTDKVYMGSWGKGICVLKDAALQSYYDCANSGLSYIYNTCDTLQYYDNMRIGGLKTDANGTLWVVNSEARQRLQALTTDGTWHNMRASFVSPTAQLIGLIIDDYDNKWVLRRRELPITYNDKNTPENTLDDVTATIFPPQGAEDDVLRFNEVFSFAKDKDGDIWLGTDRGIRVVYTNFLAEMAAGTNVEARAPIYEGYPLLRSQAVTAIAVDGGNRKWIGTGEGVFLVSSSGEKILAHFTAENSPLISNYINDIAIDDETGEVFFGTTKGTISYRAGATEGKTPCEIAVFPNPVFSDFEGEVSISGSAEESVVKIVSISGMLVRELNSAGGTALWDGRDIQGQKVASGVYLVLVAQKNGQNACVGKLTVIKK